jgi:hypothetical protein
MWVLSCIALHRAFLETVFELPDERLRAFSGELDVQELEARLLAFKRVCMGGATGGTIGKLPIAAVSAGSQQPVVRLFKPHQYIQVCV